MDPSPTERLYDEWLDAALEGNVEDPATFCARHGVEDAELLSALRRLHEKMPSERPHAGPPRERLGEFVLGERLGDGGMGVVWSAIQESLDRKVALKVIRPEFASSPAALDRFRREAEAIARLRHPHVVSIFGSGVDDGIAWIAMEFVPGRSLDEALADGPPRDRVLTWFRQIASALAAAHAAGVIHRDVKPSNIRITPDDEARLLDFGLARDVQSSVTATRSFSGSPLYASPEQWSPSSRTLDERTDIWSLGATLYEALTGRTPFSGASMESLMNQVLSDEPTHARSADPTIPKDLAVVVMRCLEKNPAHRYETMQGLADDLEALAELRPISARPGGPLLRATKWARRHRRTAAALVVALLLAAGSLVYATIKDSTDERERRAEAASLVAQAIQGLLMCETRRHSITSLEAEAFRLERQRDTRYLTRLEEERLKRVRLDADQARLDLDLTLGDIRTKIDRARRLHDRTTDLETAWIGYCFEKWAEAHLAEDLEATVHYRDLVLDNDATGEYAERVLGRNRITIDTDPTDARVYLYRYHDIRNYRPDEDERWVPVGSVSVGERLLPGLSALRVVKPVGDGVYQNDLILEIAGQPAADSVFVAEDSGKVRRLDRLQMIDDTPVTTIGDVLDVESGPTADGSPRSYTFVREERRIGVVAESLAAVGIRITDGVRLAAEGGFDALVCHKRRVRLRRIMAGTVARATAAPIIVSTANALGKTPLRDVEILPGRYVALVRKVGYQDRRILLTVPHAGLEPQAQRVRLSATLIKQELIQDGYVYVSCDEVGCGELPFWIMEREVTTSEYAAFLNDPEVDRKVRATGGKELVPHPRSTTSSVELPIWTRDKTSSRWVAPAGCEDHPVLGVSLRDAQAFAAWRNRTTGVRKHGWEYALPSNAQYTRACGNMREWVFGERWAPKAVKSRFARRSVRPEPVFSYPLDESRWGVFDLAGSAAEWLDERRPGIDGPEYALAGGCWEDSDPKAFRTTARRWRAPDVREAGFGFRLVLQPAR